MGLGERSQDVGEEDHEGGAAGDHDFARNSGDSRPCRTRGGAIGDRQRGGADHAGIDEDLAREQRLNDERDRHGGDEADAREVAVDAAKDEMDPDREQEDQCQVGVPE